MEFDELILGFARTLRKGGVQVSPGEIEDALMALKIAGIENFKTVLSCTLVKRTLDKTVFEKLAGA